MKTAPSTRLLAGCLAASAALAGCDAFAPQQPQQPTASNPDCATTLPSQPTDKVWPAAPDRARIAYVGTLRGNAGCPGVNDTDRLGVYYPRLAVSQPQGGVLVAGRGGVVRFDGQGDVKPFAAGDRDGVRNPRGMALAGDGNVVLVDSDRKSLRVYTPAAEFVREFGQGLMDRPNGLAVDRVRGRIYVTDILKNNVQVFDTNGSAVQTLGATEGDAALILPVEVAVNSEGHVFVLHNGSFKVSVFSPEGTLVRRFGEQGVWPGQQWRPKGIAIDSEDHVYVTDSAFGNFQIFDKDGQFLLTVGEPGLGDGQFTMPSMISIDSLDRIYVTDFGFHRVQVFQYLREQH